MTARWLGLSLAFWASGTPCSAQEIVFEGHASEAIWLTDELVVVAAGNQVVLVSSTGRRTVTRVEGSFASVGTIGRGAGGDFVVWDDSLWAAFVFDHDDERRVVPFAQPRMVSGEVNFVALLAEDIGLFEEVDMGNPFAPSAGRYRHPVRFVGVGSDGTRSVLWEAQGREGAIYPTEGGMSSAPIIFGYGALAAAVDANRFVVAQTELEQADIVSRDGRGLGVVSMPPFGDSVSEGQIEQERRRLIETDDIGRIGDLRLEDILGTMLPEDRVDEALAKLREGSAIALRATSANSLPPRISDLRVDGDGRVWMRRFAAPGASTAVWDVQPLDGGARRELAMPADWTVLDARGERLLVGVRDAAGTVTTILVSGFVSHAVPSSSRSWE